MVQRSYFPAGVRDVKSIARKIQIIHVSRPLINLKTECNRRV